MTTSETMNDKQLIGFVQAFRRGILGGDDSDSMCFAICAPLVTLLNASGVGATMVEGVLKHEIGHSNHFWLELPDGRVIDPTADQFNRYMKRRFPKVYLGPRLAWLHEPSTVHE